MRSEKIWDFLKYLHEYFDMYYIYYTHTWSSLLMMLPNTHDQSCMVKSHNLRGTGVCVCVCGGGGGGGSGIAHHGACVFSGVCWIIHVFVCDVSCQVKNL